MSSSSRSKASAAAGVAAASAAFEDEPAAASHDLSDCSICYRPPSPLVSCDSCASRFCQGCLAQWVSAQESRGQSRSCPMCRQAMSGEELEAWTTVPSGVRKEKSALAAAIPLSSAPGGLEELDEQLRTPLCRACKAGNAGAVAQLLRAGASVLAADRRGLTSLHLAARNGLDAICMMLLEHGAPPDVLDTRNHSALDFIEHFGHQARMPRTYSALLSGAFSSAVTAASPAHVHTPPSSSRTTAFPLPAGNTRGFGAQPEAASFDVRAVKPSNFDPGRFCMEFPANCVRGDRCRMVHDLRLLPEELGGSLRRLPLDHRFHDQRDEDSRHPMRLQKPEGRDILFRSRCYVFDAGDKCVHGDYCKFLHVGPKTSKSTALPWLGSCGSGSGVGSGGAPPVQPAAVRVTPLTAASATALAASSARALSAAPVPSASYEDYDEQRDRDGDGEDDDDGDTSGAGGNGDGRGALAQPPGRKVEIPLKSLYRPVPAGFVPSVFEAAVRARLAALGGPKGGVRIDIGLLGKDKSVWQSRPAGGLNSAVASVPGVRVEQERLGPRGTTERRRFIYVVLDDPSLAPKSSAGATAASAARPRTGVSATLPAAGKSTVPAATATALRSQLRFPEPPHPLVAAFNDVVRSTVARFAASGARAHVGGGRVALAAVADDAAVRRAKDAIGGALPGGSFRAAVSLVPGVAVDRNDHGGAGNVFLYLTDSAAATAPAPLISGLGGDASSGLGLGLGLGGGAPSYDSGLGGSGGGGGSIGAAPQLLHDAEQRLQALVYLRLFESPSGSLQLLQLAHDHEVQALVAELSEAERNSLEFGLGLGLGLGIGVGIGDGSGPTLARRLLQALDNMSVFAQRSGSVVALV